MDYLKLHEFQCISSYKSYWSKYDQAPQGQVFTKSYIAMKSKMEQKTFELHFHTKWKLCKQSNSDFYYHHLLAQIG